MDAQQQDDGERRTLIVDGSDTTAPPNNNNDSMAPTTFSSRNQWILFALASGACAAFNGVFAKLTTTELTSSLSEAIARLFGLSAYEGVVEAVTRAIFFGLNLVFNGVMWTLFTTALARGNSTTQVSIMNTSANFVITAILGFAIFSESLPPLWWLGAAMLVAGNVIIGRKDEGSEQAPAGEGASSAASLAEHGASAYEVSTRLDELRPEDKRIEDGDILDLNFEETDELVPPAQRR